MRKKRYSSVVNIIIIALVILFSVFIALTISNRRSSAVRTANPQQGAGAPAGQRTAGPAAAGQGAAGQRTTGPAAAGQGGALPSGSGQSSRNSATAVRVTPVILDTIENTLIINGDVVSSTQLSVMPPLGTSGIITEVKVRVGDTVRRGQTIAIVDPSRPGDLYNPISIPSTASGTVLQVLINPGDLVGNGALIAVGDTADVFVETFVPERFSVLTKTALPALVWFEAMPGETFAAAITEVSPVLDPATRTLRIRLRFAAGDSRIRPGMFATVSLVIGSHENVPVVPRSSIINTYGNWIAYVVTSSTTAERRIVKTGFETEDYIEIISGLVPGERVVTAGQTFLSDGDPVRVVE
ncbi:MAG: efflux RND transporter periplasmic adaptor subunit [Spirochaetaceae bacterium]|jgi:multidrug efflux pump subunit AcrA (membrane-fusion protein)|nr:efflux RND transporter periplasmic adaptor subunit [Spirochaetaceae bacterium]